MTAALAPALPEALRTRRPTEARRPGTAGLLIGAEAEDLLFRQARSASQFTQEPVTDGQLAAVYDLIKFGPTAFNQQPLRILAIRGASARQRLYRHLHGHNRVRAQGAPLVVVLAADLNFHEQLGELMPGGEQLRDHYAGAPLAERREQARYNALLQVGYFIVGVRAAGLAAGPMLGFDDDGLNRDFFPDGNLEAVLVVNLGRPLPKSYDRLPRLPYDRVVNTL